MLVVSLSLLCRDDKVLLKLHSLALAVFPFFELQQWMEAPDQDEGSNRVYFCFVCSRAILRVG